MCLASHAHVLHGPTILRVRVVDIRIRVENLPDFVLDKTRYRRDKDTDEPRQEDKRHVRVRWRGNESKLDPACMKDNKRKSHLDLPRTRPDNSAAEMGFALVRLSWSAEDLPFIFRQSVCLSRSLAHSGRAPWRLVNSSGATARPRVCPSRAF